VIDPQNWQLIEDIQEELDRKFPSPEKDLIRMAESLGSSPSSIRQYAEIRFLHFEIDNLIQQLRWHIGQALLLFNSYPQIAEGEQYVTSNPHPGLPTRAYFFLRSLTQTS